MPESHKVSITTAQHHCFGIKPVTNGQAVSNAFLLQKQTKGQIKLMGQFADYRL